MARIDILDATAAPDEWHAWLEKLPQELCDIYFSPHYCRIYVSGKHQQAILYAYEESGMVWLHPFLKTRLPDHLIKPGSCDWFDIESCHGYCGPLANTNNARFIEKATASFDKWCQEANVVAEFVRLHPLLNNQRWLSGKAEVIEDRKTLSIDLCNKEGPHFGISKNGREMVKKAARSGLEIQCVEDNRSFKDFFDLYDKTMQRLEADRSYYFNQDQFSALAELIRSTGWLITASFEGDLIAGAIFLKGQNWLHYHLSATDPNRRMSGATNAVILHAAVTGKAHNLTRLHLGGGTTPDENDSLLRFKRRMATDAHVYAFAKRLHRSEVYDQLTASWRHQFPEMAPKYGNRLLCYRYGRPKAA